MALAYARTKGAVRKRRSVPITKAVPITMVYLLDGSGIIDIFWESIKGFLCRGRGGDQSGEWQDFLGLYRLQSECWAELGSYSDSCR